MNWLPYALSSVILFTILGLIQRRVALESINPRAMSIVFVFWGAIFSIVIFLISGSYKHIFLPKDPWAWIFMLLAMFFYAMYERGRFVIAKDLEVSIFTTISNISLVTTIVGSFLLYSEPITQNKIIGSVLIIASLIILSYRKSTSQNFAFKNLLKAIMFFIFLGLATMLDKKGAFYFDAEIYNILAWIIPLIFIYLPKISFKDISHEAKAKSGKIMLLAAINVSGYYLQLRALTLGEETIIIPIIQTSAVIATILGIYILNERSNKIQKIISAIIAFVGSYILVSLK